MKKEKASAVELKSGTVILVFGQGEDDKYEMECTMKGSSMCHVLYEMDMWLRGKLKYGHQFKTADEALEACREALHEEITDAGISNLVWQ